MLLRQGHGHERKAIILKKFNCLSSYFISARNNGTNHFQDIKNWEGDRAWANLGCVKTSLRNDNCFYCSVRAEPKKCHQDLVDENYVLNNSFYKEYHMIKPGWSMIT